MEFLLGLHELGCDFLFNLLVPVFGVGVGDRSALSDFLLRFLKLELHVSHASFMVLLSLRKLGLGFGDFSLLILDFLLTFGRLDVHLCLFYLCLQHLLLRFLDRLLLGRKFDIELLQSAFKLDHLDLCLLLDRTLLLAHVLTLLQLLILLLL